MELKCLTQFPRGCGLIFIVWYRLAGAMNSLASAWRYRAQPSNETRDTQHCMCVSETQDTVIYLNYYYIHMYVRVYVCGMVASVGPMSTTTLLKHHRKHWFSHKYCFISITLVNHLFRIKRNDFKSDISYILRNILFKITLQAEEYCMRLM